ncbi:hypothetical protein AJ87_09230 [Rhizobium yanglingense]|nr:hypothetical protein AJ87_09230 [Rhizobium yanglingense]
MGVNGKKPTKPVIFHSPSPFVQKEYRLPAQLLRATFRKGGCVVEGLLAVAVCPSTRMATPQTHKRGFMSEEMMIQ